MTFSPAFLDNKAMQIKLNGEDFVFEGGATVGQLLQAIGVQSQAVAVEVNLHIVRRSEHQMHELKEGDSVEVVNFVGGG
ncbi:ThiS, thiamine-biosynthesis [Candidatus Magnetobacterium bavaricum]|uniref:ThiS, thiamine-biosynthesis n=1 Tax=Candidatus Magnetobacterium bavaricum TaxID=29290 RepID=A0A0F3GXM1_9BACT|nr:ThiS, thiamine-biosynthesis [Candidatus Magnetobacterium bavaricum]